MLWSPPGHVPAPGLSAYPGLWLPRYDQKWCGPSSYVLQGLYPPKTSFFMHSCLEVSP